MKNTLILLAGGSGTRINSNKIPKQFIKIGSGNFIEYFLRNLDSNIFDKIIIVAKKIYIKKYLNKLVSNFKNHKIVFVESGKNRQESSKNGIDYLKKYNPKNVLIHDSARPLTSNKLIKKLIRQLDKNLACAPIIISNDLQKNKITKKYIIDNKSIINIQTPQAFRYKNILNAFLNVKDNNLKDQTSLLEAAGIKTKFIKGEKQNFKITFNEDIDLFNKIRIKEYRNGIGYDIHRINYNSKKKLILCGVNILHPPLIGHSDADVGYHSICDSILGALSMRDIGFYFNNKNKKWRNANSKIFMEFCKNELKRKKFIIINLDINFICEKPKINNHVNIMKNNISKILNISKKIISIKGNTNEKIGFIGNNEGIAAESIVLIRNE